MHYLALIRGINVGGNSLIKMAELKAALEGAGFQHVRTYIQSGNVFFDSPSNDPQELARRITACIQEHFGINAAAAIFTKEQWRHIITSAPAWWGADPSWKHNLLIMIGTHDMAHVVNEVGALKPDIETMEPGDGVLYQSMSRALFGRTTTGKLASSPVYKQMTVRNYNTANNLLELFG